MLKPEAMLNRLPAIDSVIFDLDGTLWDTCDACAIGWNNVVRKHGIQFRQIAGDESGASLAEACGIPFVFAEYGFGHCQEAKACVSSFSQL
jgi:hypothetical protein